jgi:hypothetical protein
MKNSGQICQQKILKREKNISTSVQTAAGKYVLTAVGKYNLVVNL